MSNRILRTANADVESDPLYTHLVVIFGQWTDHDLTFTPHSPVIRSFSNGIDCDKSCERTEPCFPIQVSDTVLHKKIHEYIHTNTDLWILNTACPLNRFPRETPALAETHTSACPSSVQQPVVDLATQAIFLGRALPVSR